MGNLLNISQKRKKHIIFDSRHVERDYFNLTILIKTFYELKLTEFYISNAPK